MQNSRSARLGLRPDPARPDRDLRLPGVVARNILEELRRGRGRRATTELGAGDGTLRVASYNVHKCVGADGKFDPFRVAAVIGELGADLVALQEADRRFGRRSALLETREVERVAGLVPLPVSHLPDGLGWHGNAIFVRPGTTAMLRRLSLPGREPRGAVIADLLLPDGTGLRMVAAHFGLFRRCRTRQAEAILAAIAEGPELPTLLLGDLNEWRPGPRSALRALEPVFGLVDAGVPSFPARLPVLALDRILGCPRAVVERVEAHDTPLARLASDHLPLKARVRLSTTAGETLAAAA